MTQLQSAQTYHRLFGGRRGAVLFLLGMIFTLTGVGFITQELTPNISSQLRLVLDLAPRQVWGAMFVISGLTGVCASRWPRNGQRIGYGTLTGVAVWWTAAYMCGAIGGVVGSYRGALSWAAISSLLLIISGWPETASTPQPPSVEYEPEDSL